MNAFGMLVCCFVGRVQTMRRTLETKSSLTTSRTSRSLLTKASIAWDLAWCPIHHLLITHLHVSNFDTRNDILVVDYPVSLSPTGYMHMGSLLALNITDEDMTPMHMTMFGTWYGGVGGQQGCPSQEGGPRLIRFESPRWRPKATQVRVCLGLRDQST